MILTTEEFLQQKKVQISKIKAGAVFIYPTDTIYGIGCDARSEKAIEKIRALKERPTTPFSVIAPSKAWIRRSCMVDPKGEQWLEKLPGPYTLIFRLKNPNAVHPCVLSQKNQSKNKNGVRSIGVRIPDHWISSFVRMLGFPLITTSVNKHRNNSMNCIGGGDPRILKNVDFVIDEGTLSGRASIVVDIGTNTILRE